MPSNSGPPGSGFRVPTAAAVAAAAVVVVVADVVDVDVAVAIARIMFRVPVSGGGWRREKRYSRGVCHLAA